jgi:hypothetical protein
MSTTTFRLKRSSVAGKIPTTSQLELGEVAINTYDGLMFIKKNVNGTESIVQIGEEVSDLTYNEFYYSADSGQTVFSGADLDSDNLGYTPSLLNVYLNGVLLDSDKDYTAADGTSITLVGGADSGDILQVQAIHSSLQIGEYNYTATAAQTTFTGLDDNNRSLSYASGYIEVYLNGVLLDPKVDYTATSGNSIVLTVPAALNDFVQIFGLPQYSTSADAYDEFVYSFVGNGGQTTITGADSDGNSLSYKVGSLKVFNNGVLMSPDTDYSGIDGVSVNFTTALDSSDRVHIQAFAQSSSRPSYEDVKVTAGIYIGGTSNEYQIKQYRNTSFTPTVVGTTTAGTGTYSSQVGHYTRMGNMVTFTLQLVWSAHTGTGNLRVSGLPFTSLDETGLEYVFPVSTNGQLTYTDGDTLLARMEKNSTQLLVQTEDGAGNYNNVTMASNGSGRILVTGQYFIS